MLFVEPELPACERLKKEGINLALTPPPSDALKIGVLNLMPVKIDTETDLIRAFNSSTYPIHFTWLTPGGHISKNTPAAHIEKFYRHCTERLIDSLNALIITGAPLEKIKFEDVDYWKEITALLDYCHAINKPVLLLCWAAFAALYHHFNINTTLHNNKLSGIFSHHILNPEHPLLKNITLPYNAPQSRFITVDVTPALSQGLEVLAYNEVAGMHVAMWHNETFVTGHGEYEKNTLLNEYNRDLAKGMNPKLPTDYLDKNGMPIENWQANGRKLFNNWVASLTLQQ